MVAPSENQFSIKMTSSFKSKNRFMRKFFLLVVLITLFTRKNVFAQSARIDTRPVQDTLISPPGKAGNDQGPFRGLGRKTPIRKRPHGIGRDPLGEVVIEGGGGGGGGGGGCTSYTWYKDA